MSRKRVLFVTQELHPYTNLTDVSKKVSKLPQYTQEKGFEIRVLMPKFGTINERRHRLHEVVRLSGMNIIVDDDDFPLIIKVASIPGSRLQVYFLDNEEFFKRKYIFKDEDGEPFDDNSDRMVFFCKGVLETVKKFGWPPDVIHCHGWMTSLIPLYLKTVYKNEPIFQNSHIIYSVYNNGLDKAFTDKFFTKASINKLELDDLDSYTQNGQVNLNMGAVMHSDGVIVGTNKLDEKVADAIKKLNVPVLNYSDEEDFMSSYIKFYKKFVKEAK